MGQKSPLQSLWDLARSGIGPARVEELRAVEFRLLRGGRAMRLVDRVDRALSDERASRNVPPISRDHCEG